jgi:hypothetical protein
MLTRVDRAIRVVDPAHEPVIDGWRACTRNGRFGGLAHRQAPLSVHLAFHGLSSY